MRSLLILACLAAAVSAEFIEIGWKTCKASGEVTMVQAAGCNLTLIDERKVCLFKKETRPVIQIQFKPSAAAENLETSVRAKFGLSTMFNFPQPNRDACTFGVKCPIVAGEAQKFEQSIAIHENYPAYDVFQVNWQLIRPDSGKEVCIVFLAEIID